MGNTLGTITELFKTLWQWFLMSEEATQPPSTEGGAEGELGRARQMAEERQRLKAETDRREREAAEARAEAESRIKEVEEQTRLVFRQTQERMAQAKRIAEDAQRTADVKAEVERQWTEGTQPVVEPTPGERQAMKERIGHREGHFHIAVAGVAGSGKSSLIGALRGERAAAAPSAGYPATTELPFMQLYEIPGAGTLDIPDWQYFNTQGLYVFDCILLLFDNRFTATDVAILSNARRFGIQTYIVRSKADQHIRNIMQGMGYVSDEENEEEPDRRNELYDEARSQFTRETKNSVETNLASAGLPEQTVYIVSSSAMLSIARGKHPKKTLDEERLLEDLKQVQRDGAGSTGNHPHE